MQPQLKHFAVAWLKLISIQLYPSTVRSTSTRSFFLLGEVVCQWDGERHTFLHHCPPCSNALLRVHDFSLQATAGLSYVALKTITPILLCVF